MNSILNEEIMLHISKKGLARLTGLDSSELTTQGDMPGTCLQLRLTRKRQESAETRLSRNSRIEASKRISRGRLRFICNRITAKLSVTRMEIFPRQRKYVRRYSSFRYNHT